MATPLSQFLSFLLPTRNPPPKPPQFPLLSYPSPSSSSLSLSHTRDQQQQVLKSDYNSGACSDELTAVICPSLAHANTLYFRSAYNVQVVVEENEPEERLLNRFRREVMRAGVIQECKRRRYFENKQDEKKRRTRDAAKRNSRRRRLPFRAGGPSQQFKQEPSQVVKDDDMDADNWEMPDDGGIPN